MFKITKNKYTLNLLSTETAILHRPQTVFEYLDSMFALSWIIHEQKLIILMNSWQQETISKGVSHSFCYNIFLVNNCVI